MTNRYSFFKFYLMIIVLQYLFYFLQNWLLTQLFLGKRCSALWNEQNLKSQVWWNFYGLVLPFSLPQNPHGFLIQFLILLQGITIVDIDVRHHLNKVKWSKYEFVIVNLLIFSFLYFEVFSIFMYLKGNNFVGKKTKILPDEKCSSIFMYHK